MGIVNSYVSCKEIINRLYSSSGMQEGVSMIDMIDYVYQCMQLLGYPLQYISKIIGYKQDDRLDYTEYKFPLPDDFYQLQSMNINGIQARQSNDNFHYLLSGRCCGLDAVSADTTAEFIDNFSNEFSPTEGNQPGFYQYGITFDIKNNIVTTNIRKGKACVAYLSLPIDCDGFILIPENMKYQKVVELYLRKSIDYIAWRNDSSNAGKKAIYQDSDMEYNWYAGAAMGELKMPNEQQYNNLKNQMVSLRPKIYEYENYWRSLSSNQGFR